jgi:hypothetical protein
VNDFQLLIDLHRSSERQGPGEATETKQAMELAGLDRSRSLKIADRIDRGKELSNERQDRSLVAKRRTAGTDSCRFQPLIIVDPYAF